MKNQFESLKNGKFAKATLSPEVMRMVKGGMYRNTREVSPDKGVTDTTSYSCCGGLYDRTTTYSDGGVSKETSRTVFEHTKPYWYDYPGQI